MKKAVSNVTKDIINVIYRNICLFPGIKSAIFGCVLNPFCFAKIKHCRDPPMPTIRKILNWLEDLEMQYEVDCYTLEYVELEDKYYISFLDSAKQNCRIEIEKDIFDAYMNSRKAYTKIKNETSRYLEHLNFSDEGIYNRAFYKVESTEDEFLNNEEKKKINKAMDSLTDTQQRRIELHFINDITIRDIAKLENVQKSQIQKSLKAGVKKFKNFFERFYLLCKK